MCAEHELISMFPVAALPWLALCRTVGRSRSDGSTRAQAAHGVPVADAQQ
jgi:hypothetical protein